MPAPTAAKIIQALEQHKFQSNMARLADLDTTHSDAVREALAALKPKARIDLPCLLATVRKQVMERAEVEAAAGGSSAWVWGLHLMDTPALEKLRDELRDRADRGEGGWPADWPNASTAYSYADDFDDVQPDEEFDDDDLDDAKPRRRRQVPRRKPNGERSDAQAETPTPDPATPTSGRRRTPTPEPFFLNGIAVFDQHGRIGGDPSYRPMRPPWLLSDGDDETETDIEGEAA